MTTAFWVITDAVLLYKIIFFVQDIFLLFSIKDILKNNIFTYSCWASVENGLLSCVMQVDRVRYTVVSDTP